MRPSQVHILDVRPQDEYGEEQQENSVLEEDVSLDEIQNETIPEDDEVFVVPQPPRVSRVHRSQRSGHDGRAGAYHRS